MSSFFIGMTTMRAAKRISCHVQEGAIHLHHVRHHGSRPTRKEIIEGFKILEHCQDHNRLRLLEAMYILQLKPTLNTTNEVLMLPTISHRINIGSNVNPSTNPDLQETSEDSDNGLINENSINNFITAIRNESETGPLRDSPREDQPANQEAERNNTRYSTRYSLRPRRGAQGRTRP